MPATSTAAGSTSSATQAWAIQSCQSRSAAARSVMVSSSDRWGALEVPRHAEAPALSSACRGTSTGWRGARSLLAQLGLVPATLGRPVARTTARALVLGAIDEVRTRQVADRGREHVHQPGERPHREQQERQQRVQLETQRGLRHQLGLRLEQEDASEPDADPLAVVVLATELQQAPRDR